MPHVLSKNKSIGNGEILLLLAAAVLVLGTTLASADPELEIEITLDMPKMVVGERAQLKVTVNEARGISEPIVPSVDGLKIVSRGFQQSMQITNMQVRLSKSYIYAVIPYEAGEFTIGPVQIGRQGTTYQSRTVHLSVKKPAQAQTPESADGISAEKFPQAQATRPATPKSVIVEASVDNANPFVGQQIILLLRWAWKEEVARIKKVQLPKMPDFWLERLDNTPEKKRKIINRNEYSVKEIAVPLFPIKEGSITIGSIRIDYDEVISSPHQQGQSQSSWDPFDPKFLDNFFFRLQNNVSIEKRMAQTEPIAIHVRSLPQEGRPTDFGGGVGNFKLDANLSNDEVKVGESVTLTIELSGLGNVRDLTDPPIDIENIKTYSDTPVINVESHDDNIVGKRVHKLALVPQQAGEAEIPPISVPYFNPATERYEVAASGPLVLRVEASEEESLVVTTAPEAKDGRKRISSVRRDIFPIHERLDSIESSGFDLWWRRLRPIVYPFPMIVFAVCFAVVRHKERLRTDPAYRRYRLASKGAQNHIDCAVEAMKHEKWEDVFSECSRAVTEYLADKLNAPAGGLTPAEIETALLSLGLSRVFTVEVVGFLEECDFGRFASSVANAGMVGEHIEKTKQIIERLEREGAINR